MLEPEFKYIFSGFRSLLVPTVIMPFKKKSKPLHLKGWKLR